jgi:arylsulfatase A-like enzyme
MPGRREFRMGMMALIAALAPLGGARANPPPRPNIVFILADDLGYGDLGCYGQKRIKTPNIDRLAQNGILFTNCYAGSTVCAPSRCVLMTGRHTGHCTVRGNALVPLREGEATVARLLQKLGYATGLVGKWGLGEPGTTGIPTKQGFDFFFGYLNQHHAHNYYPDYLWRNEEKVPLRNVVEQDNIAATRLDYAPDLMLREGLAFLERHKDRPFLLYYASTLPHANNERGRVEGNGMEIPSDHPYTDEPWPQPQKNHAAMITRFDADVGRLVDRLAELGLEKQTVVFITSDNGPHKEGGADPAFFKSAGPFRGYKRDLTDGGIRVPMIVCWPAARAGETCDHPCWFADFLPTAVTLAHAEATLPEGLDGVSLVSSMLEPGRRPPFDRPLYWEFHEGGFHQAARMGNIKGVRHGLEGRIALYDISRDPHEDHDLSAQYPDLAAKFAAYLAQARTESAEFPLKRQ